MSCRNASLWEPLKRQGLPAGSSVPMGDNKQPEAQELQRILQSDDIAPVDYPSYGKRVAQIILRGVIAYWRKN
jgi:hypothetical protein